MAEVLYALEYLFRKDGMGKDGIDQSCPFGALWSPGQEVALSVFHQARSLVLHLTEAGRSHVENPEIRAANLTE